LVACQPTPCQPAPGFFDATGRGGAIWPGGVEVLSIFSSRPSAGPKGIEGYPRGWGTDLRNKPDTPAAYVRPPPSVLRAPLPQAWLGPAPDRTVRRYLTIPSLLCSTVATRRFLSGNGGQPWRGYRRGGEESEGRHRGTSGHSPSSSGEVEGKPAPPDPNPHCATHA